MRIDEVTIAEYKYDALSRRIEYADHIREITTRYYLRFTVLDKPKVFSAVVFNRSISFSALKRSASVR